jgi:hypothetical protein
LLQIRQHSKPVYSERELSMEISTAALVNSIKPVIDSTYMEDIIRLDGVSIFRDQLSFLIPRDYLEGEPDGESEEDYYSIPRSQH